MKMRLVSKVVSIFILVVGVGGVANAETLAGKIVRSSAQWSDDRAVIVTRSVMEREDGSQVLVQQLGGTVDGIGMRVSHGAKILRPGDRVRLQAQYQRQNQLFAVQSIELLQPQAGKERFVRTTTVDDAVIYWRSGCTFLRTARGGTTQIAGEGEFAIIDTVLSTWQEETRGCSNFTLVNEGASDAEVGNDGVNVIVFREDTWCRPGNEVDCYQTAAAAVTTLFFIQDETSDRNGEIIDADIEMNGVNFAISSDGQSSGKAPCKADLANTLTHEIGHLLGLDHSCQDVGQEKQKVDHNGEPTIDCGADEVDTEPSMFSYQSCGETKKSTLAADDIAGMCAIYPAATHPTSCEAAVVPTGCCSVAGPLRSEDAKHRGAALLLLLSVFGIAHFRKRTARY